MAEFIDEFFQLIDPFLGIIQLVLFLVISFIIFSILLKLLQRRLLKKVKTKQQVSNVTAFLDLLKFLFVIFLIMIAFSAYYGQWGEVGFIAGLITIALGWSLQKPISGVVAWLILVTRRPFHIGDRVIISNIKGDIENITLTHIFLDEVGGTIDGEESSGRWVMIPNSIIFEEEVINYTYKDEYILDEVVTAITYESNLEKAEEIIKKAVSKIMESAWEKYPKRITKEPHTRLMFKDSGIDIKVRYYTIATKRNAYATKIMREIWNQIRKNDDIEFAYPHTEVLLKRKDR